MHGSILAGGTRAPAVRTIRQEVKCSLGGAVMTVVLSRRSSRFTSLRLWPTALGLKRGVSALGAVKG